LNFDIKMHVASKDKTFDFALLNERFTSLNIVDAHMWIKYLWKSKEGITVSEFSGSVNEEIQIFKTWSNRQVI